MEEDGRRNSTWPVLRLANSGIQEIAVERRPGFDRRVGSFFWIRRVDRRVIGAGFTN